MNNSNTDQIYTEGIIVDGERYVAVEDKFDNCKGCFTKHNTVACMTINNCTDNDGIPVIWVRPNNEPLPTKKKFIPAIDPIYTDGVVVNGDRYVAVKHASCLGCAAHNNSSLCEKFDNCGDIDDTSVIWIAVDDDPTDEPTKENLGDKLNNAWR